MLYYTHLIGLLNGDYSTGSEIDDPLNRSPEAMSEKIAWIRQAADERLGEVELSMVIAPIVTSDRRQGVEQVARQRGWNTMHPEDVLAIPSMFIGSAEGLARTGSRQHALIHAASCGSGWAGRWPLSRIGRVCFCFRHLL